jgi:hypothetical protein
MTSEVINNIHDEGGEFGAEDPIFAVDCLTSRLITNIVFSPSPFLPLSLALLLCHSFSTVPVILIISIFLNHHLGSRPLLKRSIAWHFLSHLRRYYLIQSQLDY